MAQPHDDVATAAANVSATVVAIPSNNILNANLSGSFRDGDDDDDEHLLAATSIYEPTVSSSSALSGGADNAQPSSSLQARLGVVAIPNMQFSPSPPPDADVKPPNDFIV